MLRTPLPPSKRPSRLSNARPYPGLTISKECVGKVEAAHDTGKGVVSRPRLDAALHGCHLHVVGAGLLRQLCVGFLQLGGPQDLRGALSRALSAQYPAGIAVQASASQLTTGEHGNPANPSEGSGPGHGHGSRSQLTLLLAVVGRFLPETRLLRIRRNDCRSDFLRDFTRDSGPSMAKESLGWRVHLGMTGPACYGATRHSCYPEAGYQSPGQGTRATWGQDLRPQQLEGLTSCLADERRL